MGGVRILLRVTVSMVHTMQYGIGPRIQEGRTLREKGEQVKEPFPALAHAEHGVR